MAQYYYHFLQPSVKSDAAAIKKYEDLLAKTQAEDAANTFFIKCLKDSITQLTMKQKGQVVSQQYLDQQK